MLWKKHRYKRKKAAWPEKPMGAQKAYSFGLESLEKVKDMLGWTALETY